MNFSAAENLAATRRQVTTARQGAVDLVAVGLTRMLAAERSKVWAALTSPDSLAAWYAPISGELRQGGRFAIKGNASGTILRCAPMQAISLTWEYGAQIGQVDLRLADAPMGTQLELVHSCSPDDTMASYGTGALGVGWEWSLMELARHLDGAAQRFDEDAFASTAPGKEFVRGSAGLWGQAAVLGGADPLKAAAAAQRTAAFFLGD